MDNQPDQGFTPNQVHVCRYELKGGPTFWAECSCGYKLAGDNGVIVGSRGKIEAAATVANVAQAAGIAGRL